MPGTDGDGGTSDGVTKDGGTKDGGIYVKGDNTVHHEDANNSEAVLRRELTVLTLKKQQGFEFVTGLYNASRNLGVKANVSLLERRILSLDHVYNEFVKTAERVNLLELSLNPLSKISFQDITSMDEMYGYIKFEYEAWRAEQSKTSTGNQAAAAQSAVHGNVDSSVKLQPLELPGFNGNLGDWPMFYQIFKVNDARNVRILKLLKEKHGSIGGHNANNSEDSKKERYINRAKAIEIGDNGHNESKDYAPHPAICFESSSHCVEKAKSIVSDHIIEKIRKELQNPTLLPLPQKKSTIPDAATLVSSGTHQMFVLISLTVLTPPPPPALSPSKKKKYKKFF
uniref:Uncharacterized protein n=1 Tax=Cacopsylla melanoneura TaxID=428564 RepID=A0A8D8T1M2_9HEMI